MGSETGEKKPGYFRRTWRGDSSPWLPFWLFLLPSALIGLALGTFVGVVFLMVLGILLPLPVLVPICLVAAAIPLASAIMVWRCSRNLASTVGRIALKLTTLLLLAGALYSLSQVAGQYS